MRTGNLVIVALGLVGALFAVVVTVTWGRLPIRSSAQRVGVDSGDSRRVRLVEATRTLGGVCSAGIVTGALVAGLFGRLVMRVTAATSGDSAQGLLTDAEERVGEITFGGTLGFIIFIGLGSGLVTSMAFLVFRTWLPPTGAVAGLLVGLVPVGFVGSSDLSTRNLDFTILSPVWLAVVLIVCGVVLFGAAFGSVAARFEQTTRSTSRLRYLPCLGIVPFALIPPVLVGMVVYLGGRTLFPGRLKVALEQRAVRVVGRLGVSVAAAFIAASTARSMVEIIQA